MQIETVRLPNNKKTSREIVRHPGAVAVLAVTSENKIILVKQYRKPCDEVLIEIPAGKLEKGEEPLECAKRELIEETGYTAGTWEFVHSFYTSPGFADEKIYLYMARDLTKGTRQLDPDEFLDLIEADREEVMQMIEKDMIHDAKTLIALYRWLK
ncbi:ADP-ribose pyrophosphatase [Collibacillus ludicampi]|uniref:ADP-ribose pyrophosphatase n=1 Tax=Collibacillus ludicampi TaxID=2771369 RepID=A0AAV4LK83_9BACL|nr:ADP-ribose pyrophosphatase [Collibacillus ludicampi]